MEFLRPCEKIFIKMRTDYGEEFGYLLSAQPGEKICGFQRDVLADRCGNVYEIPLEWKSPKTPEKSWQGTAEQIPNELNEPDFFKYFGEEHHDFELKRARKKMEKNRRIENMEIEEDMLVNEKDVDKENKGGQKRKNNNKMFSNGMENFKEKNKNKQKNVEGKCENKNDESKRMRKEKNEKIEETNEREIKITKRKPRPVMIPTSEAEIELHKRIQKEKGIEFPGVDENMKHSLRFWLAVDYYKEGNGRKQSICEHFDVCYYSVYRAIVKNWKPADYYFYSPAEGGGKNTTRTNCVRDYGREEDIDKYVNLKQWPKTEAI